ncbi:ABC transporter ATP-binding protein [Desulfogranum marinum]|uniref:ABC transporter ATP-binding protein n=1 Tax=Desulfogranum marinum TaxID=453220 RepID=UPI0019640362|nr:ABC transporter ATP-binding protein [Desulfogranum marinum]MBM9513574.1 ABC transporter ATP-binding protein [Desulfogranum marinum]
MIKIKHLVFDNVKKTYTADLGKKKTALTGLTLSVLEGEVFGIVGPNGAGKSTALKILTGFIRPSQGKVTICGHSPQISSSLKKVGYLPENPCLYEHLTLQDHLSFAGQLAGYSKEKTRERSNNLLELVQLDKSGNQSIRRFSKGMTQRAALAYALFHEPEILILDEPMSGLDPVGRKLVIDIINNYNQQGNTVLFCSHILTDVERICDRIGIMHQGQLACVLKGEELGGANELESIFLKTVSMGVQ